MLAAIAINVTTTHIIGTSLIVGLPILYWMAKPIIKKFRENRKVSREKKVKRKLQREKFQKGLQEINTLHEQMYEDSLSLHPYCVDHYGQRPICPKCGRYCSECKFLKNYRQRTRCEKCKYEWVMQAKDENKNDATGQSYNIYNKQQKQVESR